MTHAIVKYKKFSSQRRFGVELETSNTITKAKVKSVIKTLSQRDSFVSKYQLSTENQDWHIKDDATCGPLGKKGPKGVEIASFVAKGAEDLKHIAEVAEGLFKAGSRVNDHCGLHIHVEATDLTPWDIGTIIAYWIKIEDVIGMVLPSSRTFNSYCRTFVPATICLDRTLKFESNDLWWIFKPEDMSYYENQDRRVNLNLVNYARALHFQSNVRKTLELRWPEGTLDGCDIKCWVRLFLSFIDNCKDRKMPKNLLPATLDETLMYLGLNHENNEFFILSEALHETKTWFLERILKHKGLPSPDRPLRYDPLINDDYYAEVLQDAKDMLNLMWEPVRKYA